VQGYPLFASASSTSALSVLFQLNVPTQFRLQGNGTVAGSTTGGAPHELEGTAVLRLTDNSSQVLQETSTSMNGSPASLDVLLTLGPGTYRLFANVDLYSSTQVGERSDGSGQLSFALTAIPAPPAAGAVLALVLAVRRRRARRA
jgi:hypothetical protein